jgi:hypothetical protein
MQKVWYFYFLGSREGDYWGLNQWGSCFLRARELGHLGISVKRALRGQCISLSLLHSLSGICLSCHYSSLFRIFHYVMRAFWDKNYVLLIFQLVIIIMAAGNVYYVQDTRLSPLCVAIYSQYTCCYFFFSFHFNKWGSWGWKWKIS